MGEVCRGRNQEGLFGVGGWVGGWVEEEEETRLIWEEEEEEEEEEGNGWVG